MTKKILGALAAMGLVATLFTALPARAAVTIPEVVQIDDPKGDANGINDQDNAYNTPAQGQGDVVGPAGGTSTDILKVWFSHTDSEISLNMQTNGNPGNLAYDSYFRFSSNAGQGPVTNDTTRGCLQWVFSVNGVAGAYTGPTEGALTDKCNVGTAVTSPLSIDQGPDTTFVTTITFPRSYSPLLADGSTLTAPFGVSRIVYVGPTQTTTVVTLDNTKRGSDYAITGGGQPPVVQPPVDPPVDPPTTDPKKPDCSKKKNKKKKACKNPDDPKGDPKGCPAYVPGEQGASAETLKVTDAATAEAPVEVKFAAGSALGGPLISGVPVPPDQRKHNYHNVQIESSKAEVGLYVKLSFPDRRDYDLYLHHANGTEATHSGDFNPLAEALSCGSAATGCTSGSNFEQLNGVRTANCQGWTTDSVAYLTEGGNVTLSFWLGEIKVDPAPPG